MRHLPCRRLLLQLIAFANGDSDGIASHRGAIRDGQGEPMLVAGTVAPETRTVVLHVLSLLSEPGGYEAVEAEIGARGGVTYVPFSAVGEDLAVAVMAPVARDDGLVYAIAALARSTPTPQGDALASRVRRCTICERFFLSRTRHRQRYDCARCRWRADKKMQRKASSSPAPSSRRRQQRPAQCRKSGSR